MHKSVLHRIQLTALRQMCQALSQRRKAGADQSQIPKSDAHWCDTEQCLVVFMPHSSCHGSLGLLMNSAPRWKSCSLNARTKHFVKHIILVNMHHLVWLLQ